MEEMEDLLWAPDEDRSGRELLPTEVHWGPGQHQRSQQFEIEIEGTLRWFQLHRFNLSLTDLAQTVAAAAVQKSSEDTGITVSNQRGSYHSAPDLLEHPRLDWADQVGRVLHECVQAAAAEDDEHVEAAGGTKRPLEPAKWPDSAPHGWLNVAPLGVEGFQLLHDHAETSYAAVFHCTSGGGSLLLRLHPVRTLDLALHSGSMWSNNRESSKRSRCLHHSIVRYVTIKPEAGSVVVFPGWLPHAVGRSDGASVRVSVAANFDLPYYAEPVKRRWLVCVRDSRPGRPEGDLQDSISVDDDSVEGDTSAPSGEEIE